MDINEFEKTEPRLSSISKSGVLVYVHELETGHLRVAIDVREDVNSDQLREAIPLALNWRDKLIRVQGRTGLGTDNGLLWSLDNDLRHDRFNEIWIKGERKKAGLTYKCIAEAINQVVTEWLYEYLGEPMLANGKVSPYKANLDHHLDGIEMRVPDPIERARKVLKTMRLKDLEIEQEINSGIEAIKLGRYPFDVDTPISGRKLISVMKWWRGNI